MRTAKQSHVAEAVVPSSSSTGRAVFVGFHDRLRILRELSANSEIFT
jgi:hypothetical protein